MRRNRLDLVSFTKIIFIKALCVDAGNLTATTLVGSFDSFSIIYSFIKILDAVRH